MNLTGGGYCGWNCTEEAIAGGEDSFKRGGWHLQLAIVDEGQENDWKEVTEKERDGKETQ